MFKKSFKVSTHNLMGGKDRKKMKADLSKLFDPKSVEQFLEINEKIYCDKVQGSKLLIYSTDDYPCFVDATNKGDFFPSLYVCYAYPGLLPNIEINPGVDNFLMNGANLMWPGVKSGIDLGQFKKDDVRVITMGSKVIAVGAMACDSEELKTNNLQGLAMYTLHQLDDKLWENGPKIGPKVVFDSRAKPAAPLKEAVEEKKPEIKKEDQKTTKKEEQKPAKKEESEDEEEEEDDENIADLYSMIKKGKQQKGKDDIDTEVSKPVPTKASGGGGGAKKETSKAAASSTKPAADFSDDDDKKKGKKKGGKKPAPKEEHSDEDDEEEEKPKKGKKGGKGKKEDDEDGDDGKAKKGKKGKGGKGEDEDEDEGKGKKGKKGGKGGKDEKDKKGKGGKKPADKKGKKGGKNEEESEEEEGDGEGAEGKEEKEEEEEEEKKRDEEENKEPTVPIKVMDEYIFEAFMNALKISLTEKDLPIDPSVFYSNHMLLCKREGVNLDMKNSSYKKVGKFFQVMAKLEIIEYKEAKKGSAPQITKIDRTHEKYEQWETSISKAKTREKVTFVDDEKKGDDEKWPKVDIQEVFKPKANFEKVLSLKSKADYYTIDQVKDALNGYIKDNCKIEKKYIILDPMLYSLFPPRTAHEESEIRKVEGVEMTPEEMQRIREAHEKNKMAILKEELYKRLEEQLIAHHKITNLTDGKSDVKQGAFKGIHLVAEKAHNKNITKIVGLESFGFNLNSLSSKLQVKFACSVSIHEMPGKSGSKEMVVHGNFLQDLIDYFQTENKVDKKYITSLNKLEKKKK